ncbi:MAG TPA: HD domain-containing phosphohydrolase [Acidimicrobiales bacterium]|nr:HD domain-containing phosphohydrolase [Acidimicrobiales bacterium]
MSAVATAATALVAHPVAAGACWAVLVTCLALLAVAGHAEHEAARAAAVAGLVRALAVKDPYTGEHTARVARYSAYIGEELGLSRRRLARLHQAALLHDIGKLSVPADLLNKPGRLTDEEFARVQQHAHTCDDVLGRVDALRPLRAAAAGHHLRFDGGGYGAGEPSQQAAIVAVADAYDAMTSTRAYRRALPQDVAFEELRRRAGTQFDPRCVAALVAAVERRGERHGMGHERSAVVFAVDPPALGVFTSRREVSS